jgi:CBS domain-containing protein
MDKGDKSEIALQPSTIKFKTRSKPMTAGDVLRNKGSEVITISPDDSILEAIQTLVSKGVGSLLVVDELSNIVGILSERDVLGETALNYSGLSELQRLI